MREKQRPGRLAARRLQCHERDRRRTAVADDPYGDQGVAGRRVSDRPEPVDVGACLLKNSRRGPPQTLAFT